MERLAPYLGIVAALALGAFIVAFSDGVTVPRTPAIVTQTASSTLSVLPGFVVPPLTLPILGPKTNATATTSVPQKAPVPKKKTLPPAPVSVAPTPPQAAPVSTAAPFSHSGSTALDAPASALRSALVNIICYVPAGSGLHSISGSGVFIDPKGIILTNAHIAQYFLLAHRNVSCTVRSGSPATDSYTAALVYISPVWLRANAGVLTEAMPSGTGEYDFALLAVSSSASAAPLPASFSFVPLATTPPPSGTPVVIGSYGAQFLESNQIQSALFPTLVFGSVKRVFTFTLNTIDIVALGGSAAAQEGSSGGGVVDATGTLVGMLTTSTVKGATDARSLNAITASYIRAEYANEMGSALDLLLAESPATAIADFAPQIPVLESIITARLP